MKTYLKTIFRSFKSNAAKLLSVAAIMFLGVAFVSGLGTLSPTVEDSLENYLAAHAVPDLIVKAVTAGGVTEEELAVIRAQEYVTDAVPPRAWAWARCFCGRCSAISTSVRLRTCAGTRISLPLRSWRRSCCLPTSSLRQRY